MTKLEGRVINNRWLQLSVSNYDAIYHFEIFEKGKTLCDCQQNQVT